MTSLPCIVSSPRLCFMYWGGGVQQQKRQRTSCDFAGGMIFFVLFCSLFEDILLTKSGKNNKKEQKRSKKIKKDKNHDLFCSFLRTHFDQIGHKNVDFERVLKKNKKEQKRQRTSWVFPGGMIFFVVGPPPVFLQQFCPV